MSTNSTSLVLSWYYVTCSFLLLCKVKIKIKIAVHLNSCIKNDLILTVPAEIRWHHAKHIGPVTQLQGYGHGEPASTQPGVGTLPERQGKVTIVSESILM